MTIISLLFLIIGILQLIFCLHIIKETEWAIKMLGWKRLYSYKMQIDRIYYTASSFLLAGTILWIVS